ncbi:MAG: TetR/AcrR family transcriptional regulator [Planctomycetota bacterium]
MPRTSTDTRTRILDAAAARFRTQGFAETSVAQVMRDAGLTHGGFYAHFPSKDDLFAESVRHAANTSGDWLERQVEHLEGEAWINAWVDMYMSDAHCAHAGQGCPLPSLTSEVTRATSAAHDAFGHAVQRRLDRIIDHLPFDPPTARRIALMAYAQMAGAMMLARSLDPHTSAELRQDVAAATKALLLGRPASTRSDGAQS